MNRLPLWFPVVADKKTKSRFQQVNHVDYIHPTLSETEDEALNEIKYDIVFRGGKDGAY